MAGFRGRQVNVETLPAPAPRTLSSGSMSKIPSRMPGIGSGKTAHQYNTIVEGAPRLVNPGHKAVDFAAVLLSLLAPVLGGATELWAQSLVVFCAAVLILIDPPRKGLPVWLVVAAYGVIALALCGFLPAAWFSSLPMRRALTGELNLTLARSLSMQPWITLENGLLLASGLLWTGWLLSRSWTLSRERLLGVYAAGLLVITSAALVCHFGGIRPAFWKSMNDFGFFPNRNQTGNLLALGGIIFLALAAHGSSRGRRSAPAWLGGYTVLGAALVVNGSRAGVLLYLLGSVVWISWTTWRSRSLRRFCGLISGILLLLTLFFAFGGKTLERFIRPDKALPSLGQQLQQRFDPGAFSLLRAASWHGIGLGNFENVFAQYKVMIPTGSKAVHPESDWLWAGIELGWLAPPLILVAVLGYLAANRPRPGEPNFHLRAALVVCGLLFLLHGFVDVSGHRMGTVWPAALLLGLLREPLAAPTVERRIVPVVFRLLAALLVVVATAWGGSVLGYPGFPTSAQQARLGHRIDLAMNGGSYDRVMIHVDSALRWAPLGWELYFYRALAGVYSLTPRARPLLDFSRARYLEPRDPRVPFEEARAWLAGAPPLAFGAWVETLRRAGPARGDYFRQILEQGRGLPGVEEELFSLAFNDRELLVIFMAQASREEFRQELDKLLLEDPELSSLTREQRKQVFDQWGRKGDGELLEEALNHHPGWLETAWFGLAAVQAQRGGFAAACNLAERFSARPVLPQLKAQSSEDELRRRLYQAPDDFAVAYALYELRRRAGRTEDALSALGQTTSRLGCPRYFHYLEANLRSQKENWPDAWAAWERYLAP